MNCKPPCLAYITKSDFPELNGLPVQVFKDFIAHPDFGFCWHVRAYRPVKVYNEVLDCEVTSMDFMHADADLRPISGVPVGEDVRDEIGERV